MKGGRLTTKEKIVRLSRICSREENQQDPDNQHVVLV